MFDITGGDNDSEIHTISPAHRIGERTDFSAYPDSCTGWRAGICGQYFRSELLYFLSAGGGRETLFRRASVFCGINLALRGVSRWYRECYSEQADILQEGRIVHRIEERATAVPYASYEKTAFLNRLEYLANHASATYEKNHGKYRKYGSAGVGACGSFDLSGDA